MPVLVDQLDEAFDLVDAGNAARGQLRQPQIDRVSLLDRQSLGGLDEAAIKSDTASVDGGVENLAATLGDAGMS